MPVLFRRPAGSGDRSGAPGRAPTIGEVIRDRLVAADFTPIVHVDSGHVLGYEVSARGPLGSAIEAPEALAAAARSAGLSAELDLLVHATAFEAAVRGRVDPGTALFVRAGTPVADGTVPDDLAPAFALAQTRLRVFTQVPDRPVGAGTQARLRALERVRSAGWGVALDEITVAAQGLGLLALVHPDVLKVPVGVLAEPHGARILAALTAYVEHCGAVLVVTGVAGEADVRTARALGAIAVQGPHIGPPGPLPVVSRRPAHPFERIAVPEPVAETLTPYGLAGGGRPASTELVAALAGHLEQRIALDPDPPIVLACLPRNRLLSGEPLAVLRRLAAAASFTGALVGERVLHPVPDVTLVRLPERDPLRNEWSFVVLGPHHAVLLAARERLPRRGSDEWSYRLVHDRPTVVRAARLLLAKLDKRSPQPGGT